MLNYWSIWLRWSNCSFYLFILTKPNCSFYISLLIWRWEPKNFKIVNRRRDKDEIQLWDLLQMSKETSKTIFKMVIDEGLQLDFIVSRGKIVPLISFHERLGSYLFLYIHYCPISMFCMVNLLWFWSWE